MNGGFGIHVAGSCKVIDRTDLDRFLTAAGLAAGAAGLAGAGLPWARATEAVRVLSAKNKAIKIANLLIFFLLSVC